MYYVPLSCHEVMFKFMSVNISRLIFGLKLYTFNKVNIWLVPVIEKSKFLQK